MNIEFNLRKIARSQYWQGLYHASKENNIQLFENNKNLSGLQVVFLYWLEVYSILYDIVVQKEYYFLDEEYLKNDIKVDAFLYYRKRQNEIKLAKSKEEQILPKSKMQSKQSIDTHFNVEFA